MPGFFPPLLLALFGAWCGTFAWGPSWQASAAGALALLGALFWAAPSWWDPLRLGATGRLLAWALWIAVAASAWASPVPRAGWVALILLPGFLILPAVVERCWRREEDRRWGLRATALVVTGVSLWALVDWLALGSPRPAMPLGHHNLLAAWLVILLPLAVLPAREPGPWRFLGWTAGGLAAGTILASRSLAGCAALAVAALLAFGFRTGRSRRSPKWRAWLALLAAALLLSLAQLPRVLRIASGADPSARARGAYLAAGVRGIQARPLLGWGPGSVPWTAAAFLQPVPGVNPWGESVGELHSLPVQIGYETGATGLLLVGGLVILFFVRRVTEREEGRDPALLLGGLLGLSGGAVAALGSGSVAVTALPLAAAVAAGAALAGSGRGKTRRLAAAGAHLRPGGADGPRPPGARPLALRPWEDRRREGESGGGRGGARGGGAARSPLSSLPDAARPPARPPARGAAAGRRSGPPGRRAGKGRSLPLARGRRPGLRGGQLLGRPRPGEGLRPRSARSLPAVLRHAGGARRERRSRRGRSGVAERAPPRGGGLLGSPSRSLRRGALQGPRLAGGGRRLEAGSPRGGSARRTARRGRPRGRSSRSTPRSGSRSR